MLQNQLLNTSVIYSNAPQSLVRLITDFEESDKIYLHDSDILNAKTVLKYISGSVDTTNIVTLDTAQIISGSKTFISNIVLGSDVALVGTTSSGDSRSLALITGNTAYFGSETMATVIASSDTNLIHSKAGTTYTIWDASNSNLNSVDWIARNLISTTLTTNGDASVAGILYIGADRLNVEEEIKAIKAQLSSSASNA